MKLPSLRDIAVFAGAQGEEADGLRRWLGVPSVGTQAQPSPNGRSLLTDRLEPHW